MIKENNGVWLSDDGHAYTTAAANAEVDYIIDERGYYIVPNRYLSKPIDDAEGLYLHRMIVFSFGDCNGKSYREWGSAMVVDHLDMDHSNNSVSNLQLVSYGINLFRAYRKLYREEFNATDKDYNTDGAQACKNRLIDYYVNLDPWGRKVLDLEIQADINGTLK